MLNRNDHSNPLSDAAWRGRNTPRARAGLAPTCVATTSRDPSRLKTIPTGAVRTSTRPMRQPLSRSYPPTHVATPCSTGGLRGGHGPRRCLLPRHASACVRTVRLGPSAGTLCMSRPSCLPLPQPCVLVKMQLSCISPSAGSPLLGRGRCNQENLQRRVPTTASSGRSGWNARQRTCVPRGRLAMSVWERRREADWGGCDASGAAHTPCTCNAAWRALSPQSSCCCAHDPSSPWPQRVPVIAHSAPPMHASAP